jgi:DNA-binding NarL/FixJ family response regulator
VRIDYSLKTFKLKGNVLSWKIVTSYELTLPSTSMNGLTPRLQEVARGVIVGMGNKEIAAKLNISERTVKFHISELLERCNCRNRQELFTYFRMAEK